MTYHIHNDDVLTWAQAYDGEPFHAALLDPPYHLTSITERFGKEGSAPAQYGKDGAFQRASRGFMNSTWDGGDIAFRPEFWVAYYDLLYPGAFGFAFASTRGYHRMACAIEDAGFIIHPMICYAFGTGFPKATNISAQIDKAAGVQGEIVGEGWHAPTNLRYAGDVKQRYERGKGENGNRIPITAPATELAQAWQGHRYGLQAIKPALEPICVFQRPYEGKPVDCMVRTGAGALNIDAGRIGTEQVEQGREGRTQRPGYDGGWKDGSGGYATGRWPSNLILGHSAACDEHGCAADCAVEAMGRQSGVSSSGQGEKGSATSIWNATNQEWKIGHDDTGTAARYFQYTDWALDQHDPFYYTAKSSTAEREAGLEHFTPTTTDDGRNTPIDNPYLRGETTRRNTHPTLKPLSLTRYLASLLLPPDAYAPRRLLVPFSGSGSEAIGAMLAGWDEIHGIELSAEYCEIAQARLAFWSQRRHLAHVKLQQVKHQPAQHQASLFDTLFHE